MWYIADVRNRLREKMRKDRVVTRAEIRGLPPPSERWESTAIHPQSKSPLFSSIPVELRTEIFKFALSEYPDEKYPYSRQSYYYRPSCTARPRVAVELLFTCRQIYIEVHLLGIQQAEFQFWGTPSRGPPSPGPPIRGLLKSTPEEYFSRMTALQVSAVRNVQYFTQQFFLEGSEAIWKSESMQNVVNLKITLRHTDWWFWENGDRLGIDPWQAGRTRAWDMRSFRPEPVTKSCWGNWFRHLSSLKRLEMELETVVGKAAELDNISSMAKLWVFPLKEEGLQLVFDAERGVQKGSWKGSALFDGPQHTIPPHRLILGGTGQSEEPELEYYVLSLGWRAKRVENRIAESNMS